MEDKVSASLRPLNCTANDVQMVSFLAVGGPSDCVAGEPIEVTLKAALVAGASERYDIGLFIALDGGNALTGQCLQDYLPPPLQPAPPNCTGTPNLDGGPYFNAECTKDPADTCGDLTRREVTYRGMSTLTLACQDTDGDGMVDIGTCVSWDNQKSDGKPSKPSCTGPDQTLPNTRSKCRCEAVQIGEIEFRGGIRVIKVTEPPGDRYEFQFTLTGGPDGVNVPFTQSGASPAWLSPALKAGTYALNEAIGGTGWEFTHLECRNGNDVVKTVTVDYTTGDVTGIEIARGEVVTCTFTNVPMQARTRVEKVTVPTGFEAGWKFKLYRDGAAEPLETVTSVGAGYVDFTTNLQAGSYAIVETGQYGWDNDGGSAGCTFTVSLPADRGRVFSCTFTNTKQGTVVIQKSTVPAFDPTPFTFVPSYRDGAPFTLTSGNTDSIEVKPGAYTVREEALYGWDLTDLVCIDPDDGTRASLAQRQANLDVDAGETVVCTFTNTKQGTVVIQKSTVPAFDPTPFTFVPSYRDGAPFTLTSGNTDSIEVKPGAYTVREEALYGWDLTDLVCIDPDDGTRASLAQRQANLDVDAGETVVCTFTNTKQGTVVIQKSTVPAFDPTPFTFVPSYRDGAPFTLTSGNTDSIEVKPGAYTVREETLDGWDLTDLVCIDPDGETTTSLEARQADLDVDAGETVVCTFTNSVASPTAGTAP